MSNKKPVAVLFDFDGVVVNSFNVHFTAWKNAYKQLFKKDIPDFPTRTHAGKSPILIAQYFCDYAGFKDKAIELNELKGELLHRGTTAPILLPGVHNITKYLKSENIPFGIASNATTQFITNSIAQLQIDFSIYTGVEAYEFPKPHPEAYLTLANKLEVKEEDLANTWVFEDSVTGITAAKSAGMIPVGILTQQSEADLKAAGAQLLFPTLQEAFEYLSK